MVSYDLHGRYNILVWLVQIIRYYTRSESSEFIIIQPPGLVKVRAVEKVGAGW